MKTRMILTVGFFALLAAAAAYGQNATIRAQIDFPFIVEGRTLPAGTFDFVLDDTASVFRVTGGGKEMAAAQVLTRTAAGMHTSPADGHVVFDKMGEAYTLAEIWIPGQDGYVLAVTKAKHEHRIVNVKY
ncbi:MAG: hypothetical protein WCC00_11785 [Candidatus Aminicenantales bacterium]